MRLKTVSEMFLRRGSVVLMLCFFVASSHGGRRRQKFLVATRTTILTQFTAIQTSTFTTTRSCFTTDPDPDGFPLSSVCVLDGVKRRRREADGGVPIVTAAHDGTVLDYEQIRATKASEQQQPDQAEDRVGYDNHHDHHHGQHNIDPNVKDIHHDVHELKHRPDVHFDKHKLQDALYKDHHLQDFYKEIHDKNLGKELSHDIHQLKNRPDVNIDPHALYELKKRPDVEFKLGHHHQDHHHDHHQHDQLHDLKNRPDVEFKLGHHDHDHHDHDHHDHHHGIQSSYSGDHGDAKLNFRVPRLFTVLSRITSRRAFVTGEVVTAADVVTIRFASCVPSDVFRIIGPSCV